MYLPRLPTPVIRALRSWRANAGREMPGAILLRLSSAARMRRPVDNRRQGSDDVFYFREFRHTKSFAG